MILLNEPWSLYERRIALERRRRAVRLALIYWFVAMGILATVFMAGQVLAYLGL